MKAEETNYNEWATENGKPTLSGSYIDELVASYGAYPVSGDVDTLTTVAELKAVFDKAVFFDQKVRLKTVEYTYLRGNLTKE